MNIQAQLFRKKNKIKHNSKHWNELLEQSSKKFEGGAKPTEVDGEIFYNAAFFKGAEFGFDMFVGIYNGVYSDSEATDLDEILDNPKGEVAN